MDASISEQARDAARFGNLDQDDIIAIWMDEKQCRNALEIARTEPDLLLPGHDPLLLEKYPDGVVI